MCILAITNIQVHKCKKTNIQVRTGTCIQVHISYNKQTYMHHKQHNLHFSHHFTSPWSTTSWTIPLCLNFTKNSITMKTYVVFTHLRPLSQEMYSTNIQCPTGRVFSISGRVGSGIGQNTGKYRKYRVIPDILGYPLPDDFQNWIGSGIEWNTGYRVGFGYPQGTVRQAAANHTRGC